MKKICKHVLSMFLLLIFLTSISYAEQTVNFKDLNENHWAYSAIAEMKNLNIINGFNDGTFKPNEPVTREQFAKILVLAFNIPKQSSTISSFADVPLNCWAYQYIDAAKQYFTIYNFNNAQYFNGNDNIKREDVAVAIVKVMLLDNQTPDFTVLNKYHDTDKISNTFKKYVALAIKNHIMEGNSENYLFPQESLSRAEACVLISRAKAIKSQQDKIKDGTDNPILVSNLYANYLNNYDNKCLELQIVDNWIYYINHSDNGNIYKISISGTNRMRVEEEPGFRHQPGVFEVLNVIDGWIYYSTNLEKTIYKMKLDGTEKKILTQEEGKGLLTNINIIDDYIYYWDSTCENNQNAKISYTNTLYRVKSDGSQKVLLIKFTY